MEMMMMIELLTVCHLKHVNFFNKKIMSIGFVLVSLGKPAFSERCRNVVVSRWICWQDKMLVKKEICVNWCLYTCHNDGVPGRFINPSSFRYKSRWSAGGEGEKKEKMETSLNEYLTKKVAIRCGRLAIYNNWWPPPPWWWWLLGSNVLYMSGPHTL